MDIPVYSSVLEALQAVEGAHVKILGERDISGGCINSTSVINLDNKKQYFIKRNHPSGKDAFSHEALGLRSLKAVSDAPAIPSVYGIGVDQHFSFILMEYIKALPATKLFWEKFGSSLAMLHKNGRSSSCGFMEDNTIGASPQMNHPLNDWIDFFRIRRLEYQFKMAKDRGLADPHICRLVESVMKRLDQWLIPCDDGKASLLHGDLWSGNFICGPADEPYIIDPAVYYGHRESDLAMTELFGGFDPVFYAAYRECWPLEEGYAERRDLYNLYHMLNHLNIFGGTYAASVRSIASRYS